MAHYAVVNSNNIVTQVFVGRDEDDLVEGVDSWEDYYAGVFGEKVLRTSYNTFANVHVDPETGYASDTQEKAFRGNYAAPGYSYDEGRDAFIAPRPMDDEESSWEWDEDGLVWREIILNPPTE